MRVCRHAPSPPAIVPRVRPVCPRDAAVSATQLSFPLFPATLSAMAKKSKKAAPEEEAPKKKGGKKKAAAKK